MRCSKCGGKLIYVERRESLFKLSDEDFIKEAMSLQKQRFTRCTNCLAECPVSIPMWESQKYRHSPEKKADAPELLEVAKLALEFCENYNDKWWHRDSIEELCHVLHSAITRAEGGSNDNLDCLLSDKRVHEISGQEQICIRR